MKLFSASMSRNKSLIFDAHLLPQRNHYQIFTSVFESKFYSVNLESKLSDVIKPHENKKAKTLKAGD